MTALACDSTDLGGAERFLGENYAKLRLGGAAGRSLRMVSPEVGFDDLEYASDVDYDADPPGLVIVSDVISNTITMQGERGPDTFGPGDQFLIGRPGLRCSGVARSARLRFSVLAPALLARVGAGRPDAPVQVLDHRPVSKAAELRLKRSIAFVRNTMIAGPDPDEAPLVASTASQYLAASVLQTYPNDAVAGPSHTAGRDVHPEVLRRGVAFIESNPDMDIAVADIARAACVTPRALQLTFRRHLDTTPMAYLRQVRLGHARADLIGIAPDEDVSITTIAYRWGFPSPSRFAQHYRAAYGETPGQTLKA